MSATLWLVTGFERRLLLLTAARGGGSASWSWGPTTEARPFPSHRDWERMEDELLECLSSKDTALWSLRGPF